MNKPVKVKSHLRRLDFPKGSGKYIHAVVYVPSTKERKVKILPEEFTARQQETESFLRKLFGGTTRVSGVGTWFVTINNKKELIKEEVAKIESFTEKADYYRNDLKLKKWLLNKKKEWGQESISFEYEEELFFV